LFSYLADLSVDKASVKRSWAAALAEGGHFDKSAFVLESLTSQNPLDVEAQVARAHLAWLMDLYGDHIQPIRDISLKYPARLELRLAVCDLFRRSGDNEGALAHLEKSATSLDIENPSYLHARAILLRSLGRITEGYQSALAAVKGMPHHNEFQIERAIGALCVGDFPNAKDSIEWGRARYKWSQEWLAYQATLWQCTKDSRYEWLIDYTDFVTSEILAPGEKWSDIAAFNKELAISLNSLHKTKRHPLDQSVRDGTQTAVSLLDPDMPNIIKHFISLATASVAKFGEQLETNLSHPFNERKAKSYRLIGCWSIKLPQGGYHASHIHPKGWLSSAYYVCIPDKPGGNRGSNAMLTFGVPSFSASVQSPEFTIPPSAGQLVLFPSFFWHSVSTQGTNGERLSIAFDAVPIL
jgi:uncharacterized protein (TIGR02466 family)